MNILTLEKICKTLGNTTLFEDVTLGIGDHDRIGVVGVNGTGKSTLLSIIAGVTEEDTGSLITRNGLRIAYLSQDPVFDRKRTILENVVGAIRQDEEYWNVGGEAKTMLLRLGIPDPDAFPDVLSGGQKKRSALAAALLTPCDLLILDEPTNHLDHEMIEWLQDWLEHFRGALVMVTHDRYFLDEVADTIWEIDRRHIYSYPGNFEKYLEMKQERMNYALSAERKMAAIYRKDLAWMMRGARARSTKQKAHIQRFEALRDREKIVEERNILIESLSSRMGNKTIEVTGLTKSYGDRILFRDFTYTFLKNDRIGVIGPNGCGKSTLLKILLGQVEADSGTVEIGQTIRTGYFGQENEMLTEKDRVIDYIRDTAEYVQTSEGLVSASAMCERFLFDGNKQYSPIAKLSGGEKRRLYLLRVLMEAPNVLLLDEPTNDLDIQTLQILEDYLDRFAGIVITVSHDRYFLDRVVNRIFSFEEDGTLRQSEGGYEEYLLHTEQLQEPERQQGTGKGLPGRAAASSGRKEAGNGETGSGGRKEAGNGADGNQPDIRVSTGPEMVRPDPEKVPKKKKGLSFIQQKEYEGLESVIDQLTEQSSRLEEEIREAATDYVRLQELSQQKEAVDEELEAKIARFLELEELKG